MNRIKDLFKSDEIDPESRNRFLLIAGMVAVVVFALGLIAVGYYVDRVEPRGDTVFTVGDREFSYAYLEDRVLAADAQGLFNINNVTFGIAQMVSDIQNEELTRRVAEAEGVTLTEEELENGMKADLGLREDASHNAFASALRNRLRFTGLELDRYEDMIEAQVLRQKIEDSIETGLPDEMEQVDLNVILVDTDAAAAEARQRIVDGEDFAEVATEVSQHSSSADGGDLGWTPPDLLVQELADVVFTQEVDTLSEVIETERGFYITRVDGREVRALDAATRFNLVSAYFGDKLEAASEQYVLENSVTVGQAQQIANQLQVPGG